MNDPESNHPNLSESAPNGSAAPASESDSTPAELSPESPAAPSAEPPSERSSEWAEPLTSTTQIISWPAPHEPLAQLQEPAFAAPVFAPLVPQPPQLIPNIGHFAVFVSLIIPAFIGGYIFTILGVFLMNPHGGVGGLLGRIATLARDKDLVFAMSMQAAIYGVLWALTALVFGLWWHGFARGIHWNAATAKRLFLLLAGAGVATGLLITLAGNFVPMPKAPPILEDLTKSRFGAWFLMIFGITLAPLTEELAFRGFLLPSLVNIFRWLERKRAIGESAVRYIGVPVSIVLTSIPFALIHAEQVSNSWGPVLLIGCVSIILCVIRLRTDSVACGIVVHSFYNLTLFTGLLIQTDGFRHLEKLKG